MTLAVRDISISLDGQKIVKGASLAVSSGELVALIGPNGAGKSTLLKALAGLLPYREGAQNVPVSASTTSIRKAARLRAWLGQDAVIHWPVTVERLVALGRLPHLDAFQAAPHADREAIHQALSRTGCLHLADRPATHLSAGERARVLLARALATGAPFLLADEPVAALDPAHAFHMMDLLAEEAKAGCGVLVVLHDLNLAARYADRLVLMHEGQIIAEGAADHVLDDHNLARSYGIRVARGPHWLVPVGRSEP
ncbi:hemin import ATP-binding protein HmuV [alpha proteobacterium Q-1]|nr:hemin import ATP-binding protein HmuV [alpha proteobacterium Q-1]